MRIGKVTESVLKRSVLKIIKSDSIKEQVVPLPFVAVTPIIGQGQWLKKYFVTLVSFSRLRGGTDGAQLSFRGLPCPNLGTGGYAFHGPYEHITSEHLEKMTEILINIMT